MARVCVDGVGRCRAESAERSKPQDGAAMPPRGRGRRPRLSRSTTTTSYVLTLYCSSSGRESNFNVTYDSEGRYV